MHLIPLSRHTLARHRPNTSSVLSLPRDGRRRRDRAKERREEANPDYEGDQGEAALGVHGPVPGVTHHDHARQLSIEESKFLGGDVEHTHLVKGLDFALLRKVRAELSEGAKDEAFERGRSEAGVHDRGQGSAVDGTRASFRTAMARSVYELAVKGDAGAGDVITPNERFVSGRVSFLFDVGGDRGKGGAGTGTDVPTMTMQSRSDVNAVRGGSAATVMLAGRDAAVLNRLSKLMVYTRAGGKAGKKMKRKEGRAEMAAGLPRVESAPTETAPPSLALDADDDDIFGDVGRDYEVTLAKKKSDADGDKAGSYFGAGHAKGEAAVAVQRPLSVQGAVGDGEAANGDVISVDTHGLVGPMPEPSAPDFKSIDAFKAHYRAYVSAGTVSSSDGTKERWDANAAGSYLQTCPDFALAITTHSVACLEAEEAIEKNTIDGKGETSEARPKKLLDAAAVKAELERRAEASLAADDGYAECYAGFDGYGDAVYESDDDDEGKKKARGGDEGEDGDKGGGKAGLGAEGKGVKMSMKALEAQREQKLNSELGNLHKMMKEKYGDKVDSAFGGGKHKYEEGGGRGEKRDGVQGDEDDDIGGSRRGKRLKI